MAENRKDNFSDEVNDRLSEFFGSAESSDAGTKSEKPSSPENAEWLDLKAIVLSIEWEISNKIMAQLIAKTDRLMKIYRNDAVICALLKLLNSVGRYINTKKAAAHPDSIKLLHSIHAKLQKVATSDDITEAQSKKILSTEMAKFNSLKQRLRSPAEPSPPKDKDSAEKTRAAAPEPRRGKAQSGPAVPSQGVPENAEPTKDAVLVAIDELKRIIRAEFKMLREEIKKLR